MSRTNNPCEGCANECPTNGCAQWRQWWIDIWNRNIHRTVPPVPKQVWKYEHPDRVREMRRAQDKLTVPDAMDAEEETEVADAQ